MAKLVGMVCELVAAWHQVNTVCPDVNTVNIVSCLLVGYVDLTCCCVL